MLDLDQQPTAEAAVVDDQPPADATLDRPISLGRISGEILAWAGVLLVAAVLRLMSLGGTALNPDEAQHAYAAYTLFRGTGTLLDSTAGGPLATVVSGILFFLFGISDQVARFGPALAGIGSVVALIWLRPYLGRTGALLAAVFLAISPSAVYFSRVAQPDSYAVFFALVLLVTLLRLFDYGTATAMILAAIAAALLFAAAPTGFTFLLILLGAALVVWLRSRTIAADEDSAALPPFGAAGLRAGLRAGGLTALLVALALIVLVFSAFGAIPGNIGSGLAEWFTAWGAILLGTGPSVPGRTGGFAFSLLPIYEPLVLLAGLGAIIRLFVGPALPAAQQRGGLVVRAILTGWAFIGLILLFLDAAQYPALLLVVTVPLTLLAGAVCGELIERIDWTREGAFWSGGLVFLGFTTLAILAWFSLLGQLLQPSRFADATGRTLSLLLTCFLFALPLSVAAFYFGSRLKRGLVWQVLALGLLLFFAGYSLRSAVGLNIYRSNVSSEPLVYNAVTPEIRPLMDRILRLSRDQTALVRTIDDPTGGHGLNIVVDPAVEWPVRWYLREFPFVTLTATAAIANGTAQVAAQPQLIFRPGDGQPATGGYTPETYNLLWSYPAGQPLSGADNALLRNLGFFVFRNNVPPAAVVPMTVEYGPELAQRLFLPPPPQGPFNLSDRPGAGKAEGQLDSPRGVAIAADGSIFVVDMRNARIERYAADGTFLAQFGGIGHGNGQLWREANRGPTGIAISADGFVYVADTWNYRIQKFTLDGKFVAKWGTFVNLVTGAQGGDRAGLYGPRGLAIGPNGDLYVTDTGNGRVVVYGPNGEFRREFGSKGAAPGQLDEPVGIAVSADGSRIYVADSNNARIAVFDGAGKPVAQWAVDSWRGKTYFEPYLVIDNSGALYATSSVTHEVLKFDADGKIVGRTTTGTGANEAFGAPYGIARTSAGTLYVSDGNKNFVVQVNLGGGR